MEYQNAAHILPAALVREIQNHFPGGLLWIPKNGVDQRERTELIVQLIDKGVPAREIAELAELTPRHVRRIAQKRRSGREKADANPDAADAI